MSIKTELLGLQNAAPNGVLKAEKVVAWAKAHPRSALHKSIEWSDRKAAAEYRLWQVRRMIQVHVTTADGSPVMVSLSIDRTSKGGGYRSVSDVLSSEELSLVMLNDALEELERVKFRYARVEQLTSVWRTVERVKRKTKVPLKKAA